MPMSKLTKQQELEYVIEPQVRQLCGNIYFRDSHKTADNITNNGSFGLVDTGKKKLLVTCCHIWDGFQKERFENGDLEMRIGLGKKETVVFAPDSAIGEDRELDIATFDMEPLLGAFGGSKFYDLTQNPVREVAKGDVLFFIGFPGHLRRVIDGVAIFGRSPYGVSVCGVDGWRFYSDITDVAMHQDELGGMSGCPCFLVRWGKPIQLVGFATHVLMRNLLFFTHARCLKPDGTINNHHGVAY
jgi:hypothetical protein